MSTLRSVIKRFGGMFRSGRTRRFEEEINEHAELLAADYVAQGMTASEARYAAARELGNITALQESYHDQSGLPLLENFWRDLRYAGRTLRRNRVFSASCITTLAVGFGSLITMLSVVSTTLWQPLPYPKSEALVALKEVDPRNGLWTFSEPALLDVQERSRSIASIAAYRSNSMALTGAGDPETIHASSVTASFFALFGVQPIMGRAFADDPKAVVISRGLWQRKWATTGAIGRSIALNGES